MPKWVIDADHSVAGFAVRHFMIANVRGQFGRMTGVIFFDPPDLAHLSVETEIDVRSLTTGHQARDEHLLSADFFDASHYPKIIFKSRKVEPLDGNRATVVGDMTLRGITRPITLAAESFGPVTSPFSGVSCVGFIGTAEIDREDFGMTSDLRMEGGLVIGRGVQITFDVEADLAKE